MKRLLWLLALAALAQSVLGSEDVKVYLPGDVVHVVVGAPADTAQVLSVMPDGARIPMSFEQRTFTWHAHWEVPYGFKKGSYYAKLIATDVEGKVFEGETQPFYIGEPALVTLISLELTREVALKKSVIKPRAAAPVPAEEKVEPEPVPKPKPKPKPAPKLAAKKKPVVSVKKSVSQVRMSAADMREEKSRLITALQYYLSKKNYKQARRELNGLLKIEPDSLEFRTIAERVDEMIKTTGAKK